MLLQLMRFNVVASPGKEQTVADTLSRQPMDCKVEPDTVEKVKAYANSIIKNVPIRDPLLVCMKDATMKDETLQKVIDFTLAFITHEQS